MIYHLQRIFNDVDFKLKTNFEVIDLDDNWPQLAFLEAIVIITSSLALMREAKPLEN